MRRPAPGPLWAGTRTPSPTPSGFEKNGHWGTQARPGAVVYFSWDDSSIDHMGLVKKDNGDGTITTIEGNTGNGKVEERIRPTSQVVGYGYPQYKA